MTPEEKAKQIYDKMKGFRVTNKHRKKCALVAVDEVLENTALTSFPESYIEKHGLPPYSRNWYIKVKQEIEKL